MGTDLCLCIEASLAKKTEIAFMKNLKINSHF